MNEFREFLHLAARVLGSESYFPFLLLGTGLFFTIYLGLPQFRYFAHALRVVSGHYTKPGEEGDTTHFQALSTALSGTVGTGNIAGVGFAIYLGGPAALFWMWATAFLGMATKFVEVTLSHKYRVKADDGSMAGGPMFYMERKLKLKWLAVLFAAATVISSFGTGSLPQINSIAMAMHTTFGVSRITTGAVLSLVLLIVVVGGIRRIAHFAEAVVPLMALVYIVGALAVILPNLHNLWPSFLSVWSGAFSGTAITGGFLGASFSFAFSQGCQRGLYSNEAGQGSAPIAHASAKGESPVSEGMVSLLEPFIDTLLICTLTGMVILASGVWTEKFLHEFQHADTVVIRGDYNEHQKADKEKVAAYLADKDAVHIQPYSGAIAVKDGRLSGKGFTILNARSFAEDVRFYKDEKAFNGFVHVAGGKITTDVVLKGRSRLHTVELTTAAFSRGWLASFGPYIVAIGLLLFAFSTAVAWSYYGDRAIFYLFGLKGVLPYRFAYVIGFFIASFVDTTLVWDLSAVTIVLMAMPNLIGILMLHKDMKQSVRAYWDRFHSSQVK
ncbi:MAG: sodium:alanine symporter family protein [Myxococcales bacterium]|nr:sodium:alanine symporter family protein [Myxococcales bacterium]